MSKHLNITVVPFGGLGNRMRVLNSAFYFSQALSNKSIKICWLQKAELNASISDVFSSLGFGYTLMKGLQYVFFRHFVKHIYLIRYTNLYKQILGLFYDTILFDQEVNNLTEAELIALVSRSRKTLIATCYPFFRFPSFDNFLPSNEVNSRLERLKLPENLVGVHIRRTDHIEIIQESGLEIFIEEMEAQLTEKPETVFFLATDEAEVKRNLKARFKGKMISQDVELSRNTRDGIVGAYVDILALAKCKVIICNLKSSFVETALHLGAKKEVIAI